MTTEFETMPLAATATDTAVSNYGEHPLPEDTRVSSMELPVLDGQSLITVPDGPQWNKWGRWKRSAASEAWHFYCVDSKFETLLRDPMKLADTGASCAVEVNISSFGDDPLPVALAGLYRKRCVSKIWQEQGVNVFIDLFVDGWTRELVLDGVPTDHCLYATKYAKADMSGSPLGIEAIAADFALAATHCSKPEQMVFAVYGGGKQISDLCRKNSWLWLPPFDPRKLTDGTSSN